MSAEKIGVKRLIIGLLKEKGPLNFDQLVELTKQTREMVRKRLYDLKAENKVIAETDGTFSLGPGVTPEDIPLTDPEETEEPAGEKERKQQEDLSSNEPVALDARGKFAQLLKRVAVKPESIIPTVTNIFFNGDVEDLKWLDNVLVTQLRGWIQMAQVRLIKNAWASEMHLNYKPESDDLGEEEPRSKKSKLPDEDITDPGLGWNIGKDKDGDWIAIPGGKMTREEAEVRADRRQALKAIGRGSDDDGEPDESGKAKSGSKTKESAADKLLALVLTKFVDQMTDGGKKGESEQVRLLQERLNKLENEKSEQRFQRLEAIVTEVINRDPFEEYDKIQEKRKRLGLVEGPAVTDSSPVVQLIKDSTNKMDKQLDRVAGIVERVALLREGSYNPEETRSPDAREKKKDELLGQLKGKEKSRDLRVQAFDV